MLGSDGAEMTEMDNGRSRIAARFCRLVASARTIVEIYQLSAPGCAARRRNICLIRQTQLQLLFRHVLKTFLFSVLVY